MQILKNEGLKYGHSEDKVYGVLFDGAWLWEEYLATLFDQDEFIHPKNKEQTGGVQLFSDNKNYIRYPDFIKSNVILDAKYKRLEFKQNELDRNDMHQMISYMYIHKAKMGGFVFPIEKENDKWSKPNRIGTLNGYGGVMNLYGIFIPQYIDSYKKFCSTIAFQETVLRKTILDDCNQFV